MRYPIFIERDTATKVFGVVLPDLPGCRSAGGTLEEAVDALKQAAAAWIETALGQGRPLPRPSSIEQARRLSGYEDWAVGIIDLG